MVIRFRRFPLAALFIASAFATVMLAGCQTITPTQKGQPPIEAPPSASEAEKAESAGDFVVAAREYLRLGATAQSPQKEGFQLRAADMLIRAGQPQEARALLRGIDVQGLDGSYDVRKRILEARLLSLEGSHEKAIRQLDEAARVRNIDPTLLAAVYAARAQAEIALNNSVGAVRNLITRESLLAGRDAVADNQLQIWKILNALPRAQLESAHQLTGDPILSGWIDLALIALDNTGDDARLKAALAAWHTQYPAHPAPDSLVAIAARPAPEMIGRIDRIALLLPLSSPYSVAAQAVRDGFLAMSAADKKTDKPAIKIYDVGADPTQTPEYYQQAVKEGAQVVVGPLGRESVVSIIGRGVVSVPTLLLSHTDDESTTDMRYLFQFGLPPEQEARQAAERAYLDGHRQAALLYPQNPWGERMMNAFLTAWQRLGGIVVASQAYREADTDHSDTLRLLLNINQSLERAKLLEGITRTKLTFEADEARSRQDIDFIFLVSDAKSGRLIKPQLNFYRVGRVPVYSTSHIFGGKPDPLHDADLDGVVFGDMPWLLQTSGKLPQLRQTLQGNWPNAYSDLDRLYALGMDSYALLPQLDRLGSEPGARFSGATSALSLDRSGRIQRNLTWARFNKGVPKPLDTSSAKPARFDIEPTSAPN